MQKYIADRKEREKKQEELKQAFLENKTKNEKQFVTEKRVNKSKRQPKRISEPTHTSSVQEVHTPRKNSRMME